MEPQYITRFGFQEDHAEYRTDPRAIALILGLTTFENIESAYPGMKPQVRTEHCTRDWARLAGSDGDAAAPPGTPICFMTLSLVILSA